MQFSNCSPPPPPSLKQKSSSDTPGKKRSSDVITDPPQPPVVVIFKDLEAFNPKVLQDFILICRYFSVLILNCNGATRENNLKKKWI